MKEFNKEMDIQLSEEKIIIVLASGGKDSNALIVLLEEYKKNHSKINIEYLHIPFPQTKFKKQGKIKNIPITSIKPTEKKNELDKTKKPCELCKQIRRKIIKKYLSKEKTKEIIILTGHTQDDLIAYFSELNNIPIKNILASKSFPKNKIKITKEQEEHLSRFETKTIFKNRVSILKPLLNFNRREINTILKQSKIHYNTPCCDYSCKRTKRELFTFLDALPEQEVKKIYKKYSTNKMREHIKKYAEKINLEEKEYSEYLL